MTTYVSHFPKAGDIFLAELADKLYSYAHCEML